MRMRMPLPRHVRNLSFDESNMTPLDIIDLVCSWRFYVCLIPALLAGYFLHQSFSEASWPWLISVPLVIIAFIIGMRWDRRRSH